MTQKTTLEGMADAVWRITQAREVKKQHILDLLDKGENDEALKEVSIFFGQRKGPVRETNAGIDERKTGPDSPA